MFEIVSDYSFRVVALGTVCLGLSSAMVGSYACLKEESLLADALSHAALPGIVLAFLLSASKNHAVLLLGASLSGLLAAGIIYGLSRQKVKFDSALSVVLSSFFGLGLALLSYLNRLGDADQAGLESYIFGQASTLLRSDLLALFILLLVLLVVLACFWKEFKLICFDPIQARVQSASSHYLNRLMNLFLVLVVVMGLQTVGLVLISAFIIIPPTAARQWSRSLLSMMALAAGIAVFSALVGTYVSSTGQQIPTGPVIVLVSSLCLLFSLIFAPRRGWLGRYRLRKRQRQELKDLLLKEGRECLPK